MGVAREADDTLKKFADLFEMAQTKYKYTTGLSSQMVDATFVDRVLTTNLQDDYLNAHLTQFLSLIILVQLSIRVGTVSQEEHDAWHILPHAILLVPHLGAGIIQCLPQIGETRLIRLLVDDLDHAAVSPLLEVLEVDHHVDIVVEAHHCQSVAVASFDVHLLDQIRGESFHQEEVLVADTGGTVQHNQDIHVLQAHRLIGTLTWVYALILVEEETRVARTARSTPLLFTRGHLNWFRTRLGTARLEKIEESSGAAITLDNSFAVSVDDELVMAT
jgi:hypothetical protein